MKTIPPPCPEPETGQQYWRSLDQLADTPEFRQWLEREFPQGASEWTDPVSRRHFVKIMSASFALAGLGLAGCRRPEDRILPFAKQPENYIHGVPQHYATAMPTRGSALPLLVKAHDGRPIKIEGNPEHPDSNGGTDTFAQASILSLYDPDRARRFTRDGNEIPREAAMDALAAVAKQAAGNGGAGLCFLLERNSSPSRARLVQVISQKFPQARWFLHEPVDLEGATAVAGNNPSGALVPYYKLDQAGIILSLDCDFIGGEEDTYRHCRNFAKGRRVVKPGDPMNRLYVVEGLMTLTGMNADHRLRVPTSSVVAIAAAIAAQLAPDNAAVKAFAQKAPLPAGVDPKWIAECAADLAAHKGASVVLAGHRQPAAVQALAQLLNTALGNTGKTVWYREGAARAGTLADLARLLNAGQVNTLVVLGGNPVYNAPADLDWANTQRKARQVVRLGYYEDETFAASNLHLPLAHYLESWGDARTGDGTLVPIQPLIAPLFNGVTELEVLARIGGLEPQRPHDLVRDTFRQIAGTGNFEEQWKKFLHDGFLAGSAFKPAAAPAADRLAAALNAAVPPAPTKDNLEVVFHRDYKMDDGRFNNNGWLQELPDPVTKVVWDSVVQISRKTAEELGLKNEDVVEIELNGRKVQGPIWIQPGFADNSLGLSLGYGRQRRANGKGNGGPGRVGAGVGMYDAYTLRTTGAESFAVGAKLRPTGRTFHVVTTQEHGSLEGRPIVREANWSQFKEHPGFARNMDLESHMTTYVPPAPLTESQKKVYGDQAPLPGMIYEHPYRGAEKRGSQVGINLPPNFYSDVHQWGMAIDMNTCVGCNACVLACQSENNVPIVGKDQVDRNREMHWLRIDRYYSGVREKKGKQQIDDPQVVNQPMLCQHCENAPCESVCPVNATVHDEEGLNLMAYNRCVGTRYCSNNCPYKVRRFNFLDYNRRSLSQLKGPFYGSPLTTTTDGEWTFKRWWKDPYGHHTRPDDEWELLKLAANPEVTVRMRGVMEKCTFCLQRIESAKIAQKNKAGQSGNVQVPDGTFTTACAQACPAEAIVFGNLLDPQSRVSQVKNQERNYAVLKFLDTRPRLTYQARIRNPNPKMPDYHEISLFMKDYQDESHSNPFEQHGGGEGHGAPAAPGTKGGHS